MAALILFFATFRDLVIRHLGLLYAAMALPIVILNALLLPPIQGVDENSHFLRATHIAYGHIFGERQNELVVGGHVNQAAVTISGAFDRMKFSPTTKLDRAQYDAARQLRWKDYPEVFAGFGNTVIYPPFFYLPSAAAIWFGRVVNLRIIDTLMVARIVNGLVCVLLGALALALAAKGRALMFAVLSMPMTLDLFGAVSPEGSIVALVALLVSIFFLGATNKHSEFSRFAGSAALGAIASSKPPFVALWILLASSSFTGIEPGLMQRARRLVLLSLPALVIFGLWFYFGALPYKVPFRPTQGVSSADQVQFLLHHPFFIARIVANTFHIYGLFWGQMFIGVLGWVDTWLPVPIYWCAAVALVIALSLDSVQDEVLRPAMDRILAAMALIGAITLSWLSLYITWTKVGADFVDGYQGRHLTAPALLLAIVVPNYIRQLNVPLRALQGLGWLTLLILIWICELTVPVILSTRYYWT